MNAERWIELAENQFRSTLMILFASQGKFPERVRVPDYSSVEEWWAAHPECAGLPLTAHRTWISRITSWSQSRGVEVKAIVRRVGKCS